MNENNAYASGADVFGGTFTRATYFRIPKIAKDAKGIQRINIVSGSKEKQTLYNYIQGYLVDIKTKEEEFEGKKTIKLNTTFLPPTGELEPKAILTCGFDSWFARDLLNRLANVQDFNNLLVISPYISTDETSQTSFVRCSLKLNSITSPAVKGLYPPEDIPKARMQYVEVLKKEVLIDPERQVFFEELLNQISSRLKNLNTFVSDSPVYEDESYEEEMFTQPPLEPATSTQTPPTQARTTQQRTQQRPPQNSQPNYYEPMEPVQNDYAGRVPY